MPRYFFHLLGDRDSVADREGRELVNDLSAHQEADETARMLAAEAILEGVAIEGQAVSVTDERGRVVTTVRLRDVVKIVRPE